MLFVWKKFLIRTDHSALTYLRKFADYNGRLMRWSLKLSEMDFAVEHGAGYKIGHVDALSRHVGAVMEEVIVYRNIILRDQAKETSCTKRKPGNYSSRREFFLDDKGVMYRRQPHDKHQLVVPESLVHHIIKENHDPVFVAHSGVKMTRDLISHKYWCPEMRKYIGDYIKKCDACKGEMRTTKLKPHLDKWRSRLPISK